ncbi:ATP-binding cassette domain-containing protein [Streptomyces sp. L7]
MAPGETVGVVGESGCGKSTLAKGVGGRNSGPRTALCRSGAATCGRCRTANAGPPWARASA